MAASHDDPPPAHPNTPTEIVFFDTETTIPSHKGQKYELLEFAAIVIAARGFYVLESYSTLIRPKTMDYITQRSVACNGLTPESVADAPQFLDVADSIFRILNGRIWAGHNIAAFDILRIKEAFTDIGREIPQFAAIIDTLPLLRRAFGYRAGNLKMATLAKYCGLGQQEHRSLADVQLNLDVLKHCSTILFLETNFPTIFSSALPVTTSPLLLRSSEKWPMTHENVQNAKVGNGAYVTSDGVRLERSQQSSMLLRQASNSYPSEKEVANSSSVDVSVHTLQTCKRAKRLLEEHVNLRNPMSPILQKGEDYGPFNFSAFSGTLEEIGVMEEVLEEENDFNLNEELEDFSIVFPTAEKEKCITDSLKADTSSIPSTSSEDKISFGDNPHFVEALHPKSRITNHSESIFEIGEANGCMRERSYRECDMVFPRNSDNHINAELPCNSSIDREHQVGFDPLCKATSNTYSNIIENSDMLQAHTDVPCSRNSSLYCSSVKRETCIETFLSACWVSLEALEVKKEPGPWRKPKLVLYHKGLPLKIRETNIKVRFSVNTWYAFDSNGKARFSIMIEPSTAACEVICKCDDLVKTFIANDGEITTWRPTLIMEKGGVSGARLSIGTKGSGASATYTTEFYRHYTSGVEKLVMGAVDSEAIRTLIPHGSIVDVAFDLQVYSFNGYSGICFISDHFLLR